MTHRRTELDRRSWSRLLGSASVELSELEGDARLAGVPLRRADTNGDGRIQGQEWQRLFELLDRHERGGRRRRLRLRRSNGRLTRTGLAVQAIAERAGTRQLQQRTRPGPQRHSDAILFVAITDSARHEANALRNRTVVHRVTPGSGPDGAPILTIGRRRFDLRRSEDIERFVAGLRLPPEQHRGLVNVLRRCPETSREEIASIAALWARVEQGAPAPTRMVLSGHHYPNASFLFGDDRGDSLRFAALRELARVFPRAAAAVEDLHLSACNSLRTEGEIVMWRTIFPNLRTLWGYDGKAPGSWRGAMEHQRRWEEATRGERERLSAGVARGTRFADHVRVWTRRQEPRP